MACRPIKDQPALQPRMLLLYLKALLLLQCGPVAVCAALWLLSLLPQAQSTSSASGSSTHTLMVPPSLKDGDLTGPGGGSLVEALQTPQVAWVQASSIEEWPCLPHTPLACFLVYTKSPKPSKLKKKLKLKGSREDLAFLPHHHPLTVKTHTEECLSQTAYCLLLVTTYCFRTQKLGTILLLSAFLSK